MIEVFKTNVGSHYQAAEVVDLIRKNFKHYRANFDLDDCDNILRVESRGEIIELETIIALLEESGHKAEVLLDEVIQAYSNSFLSLPHDAGRGK